jgi:hypothetical protein
MNTFFFVRNGDTSLEILDAFHAWEDLGDLRMSELPAVTLNHHPFVAVVFGLISIVVRYNLNER